jgi:hypothetical protein
MVCWVGSAALPLDWLGVSRYLAPERLRDGATSITDPVDVGSGQPARPGMGR